MNGAKTIQVNLDGPIPVLIVYGTAVAPERGEVRFLAGYLRARCFAGTAVGEEISVFGLKLPIPNPADIDVNEIGL